MTYYKELSKSYSEIYTRRINYLSSVDQLIKDFLYRKNLNNTVKVLDVGCADGSRVLSIFKDSIGFHRYMGIDLEPAMMTGEVNHDADVQIDFLNSDIAKAKLPEKQFDLVFSLWNVFGHVERFRNGCINIRDSLKPEGYFIFDVNNYLNANYYGIFKSAKNGMRYLKKCLLGEPEVGLDFKLNSDHSVRLFNIFELKQELQSLGFVIDDIVNVDYTTGQKCGPLFFGQILIFCRADHV